MINGEARNLLRGGGDRASGDGSPPCGLQGRAPVGSGSKPPEAEDVLKTIIAIGLMLTKKPNFS